MADAGAHRNHPGPTLRTNPGRLAGRYTPQARPPVRHEVVKGCGALIDVVAWSHLSDEGLLTVIVKR